MFVIVTGNMGYLLSFILSKREFDSVPHFFPLIQVIVHHHCFYSIPPVNIVCFISIFQGKSG